MSIKIGNVKINGKTVMAPMAGISNSAYRTICKSMGCSLIYAEMVSDKAIYYNNAKTIDMLYMTDYERPIAQQIFGSDEKSFVEAAKYIEKVMKPDIIDINMGCPVPKIAIRSQAGSALLKDPQKIKEIVSSVVKSVSCPVTVKIRSGWDSNSINAVEVAKIVEEAGASAITIHPRTRAQGYSGNADWNIIKQVKEAVKIPVIGNGDIKSCFDAKKMIDETGCDLVMVGRACLGNPWIFKEINAYLEDGTIIDKPTPIEKIDMCLKHFNLLLETQNKKQAVLEIRSHIAWYLKGIEGSKEIKDKIFKTKDEEEIKNILYDFKKLISKN
ncbi:MAG: tRNA dihydrouridine synthase DusB [bacterium]|nr:tRNA dihydrouridine synthase DusB [bacterium]